MLDDRLAGESLRHPRAVGLEERFASLLPEVLIGIGLEQFAALAAKALEPKPVLELSLQHIHAPGSACASRRRWWSSGCGARGTMTFRALCGDSPDTLTTVARFLSLLELFREGAVAFDQVTPLGELSVRWTGATTREEFEIDEFEGAPPEAAPTTPRPRRRQSERRRARSDSRPRGRLDDRGRRWPCAVAELRPSLEAVLMVADQPLDTLTLASAVGYPVDEVTAALVALAEEYTEQGRGFELRNVAGGWRYYTREEYAVGRRGLRARRPAGAAHPGGAGDPRRGRLQAAGLAGPGLRHPRRQRRRRDADPAHPRAGRGGRPGRRDRRQPLPDHQLLPGADRGHLARRAARAGAVPPRHGRHGGRAGRGRAGRGARAGGARPRPAAIRSRGDRDRRRRTDPAPEAARAVGRRLPPQVRGADARGPGRRGRRGRHPARHQGRPDAPR